MSPPKPTPLSARKAKSLFPVMTLSHTKSIQPTAEGYWELNHGHKQFSSEATVSTEPSLGTVSSNIPICEELSSINFPCDATFPTAANYDLKQINAEQSTVSYAKASLRSTKSRPLPRTVRTTSLTRYGGAISSIPQVQHLNRNGYNTLEKMRKMKRKFAKIFKKEEAKEEGIPEQQVAAQRAHYGFDSGFSNRHPSWYTPVDAPDQEIISRLQSRFGSPFTKTASIRHVHSELPLQQARSARSTESVGSRSEEQREPSGASTWEVRSVGTAVPPLAPLPAGMKNPKRLTTIREGQNYQPSNARLMGYAAGRGLQPFHAPMYHDGGESSPVDARRLVSALHRRDLERAMRSYKQADDYNGSEGGACPQEGPNGFARTYGHVPIEQQGASLSVNVPQASRTVPYSHSLEQLSNPYNSLDDFDETASISTVYRHQEHSVGEHPSSYQEVAHQNEEHAYGHKVGHPFGATEFSEDSASFYSRDADGNRFLSREAFGLRSQSQFSEQSTPTPPSRLNRAARNGSSDQSSPEMLCRDAARTKLAPPSTASQMPYRSLTQPKKRTHRRQNAEYHGESYDYSKAFDKVTGACERREDEALRSTTHDPPFHVDEQREYGPLRLTIKDSSLGVHQTKKCVALQSDTNDYSFGSYDQLGLRSLSQMNSEAPLRFPWLATKRSTSSLGSSKGSRPRTLAPGTPQGQFTENTRPSLGPRVATLSSNVDNYPKTTLPHSSPRNFRLMSKASEPTISYANSANRTGLARSGVVRRSPEKEELRRGPVGNNSGRTRFSNIDSNSYGRCGGTARGFELSSSYREAGVSYEDEGGDSPAFL
ncbi:MAG: hypothetical protein LQ340_001606 [Diploschistes diacapsis]|nr:MAG: hypothetical protein LQ340_001606 [Diploschistes diacapsis]